MVSKEILWFYVMSCSVPQVWYFDFCRAFEMPNQGSVNKNDCLLNQFVL